MRNRTVAFIFATIWLLKMNEQMNNRKSRRDVFQAIADPTRRTIIALVAMQAMTPNALAQHFDTSRQAVSKHLRILTECELIRKTQQGRELYYHLELQKLKEIDKWLEQFRQLWDNRFRELDYVLSTLKNKKR